MVALADLLPMAQRRALHLEMRDTYARTDRFVAWQAGQLFDRSEGDAWWHGLLAPLVSRGGDIRRLRIVSEPVTDYVRYEFEVTPFANLAGGEAVRWLPRHRASDLRLPGNDFWLVDDVLLFNLASGDGEFVGVEPNEDPEVLAFCVASFEAAWDRAVDHSDYRPT
ncbi:hypothetical protein GCM10009682_15170 [Luedemannella flava]|uniref:DUF6879 domain-containing protein n=1 Tax=Luedemannella flava TaxID=349316 RepID=A0ABP4XVE3_9ACTN